MAVHVVGNACIDTTFRLDRFSDTGETLNAISHSDGLGGKGANQAVAAARTGADVHLWAAVGRDNIGTLVHGLLSREIGTVCLTVLDLPTDRSTIAVDASGENMIFSGVSCARAFDPLGETPLLSHLRTGDVMVLQNNLSPDITRACLSAAKAEGARTILNASPLTPDGPVDLGCVDIVIVNKGEARALSGVAGAREAAGVLVDRGAGAAIVTLGARGCLFLAGQGAEPILTAAPEVTVTDASGAGDVLCGVFAGCVARGFTPLMSLRVAVAASALAVTRAGTLASCPSAGELCEMMTTA